MHERARDKVGGSGLGFEARTQGGGQGVPLVLEVVDLGGGGRHAARGARPIGKSTLTILSTPHMILLTYPTWERYTILAHVIHGLGVRERRHLFQVARRFTGRDGDVFLPAYGFTLSEFAVWYVLDDSRRRPKKKSAREGNDLVCSSS